MEINCKFSIGQFVTTKDSAAQHKVIDSKRTDADRNLDSRSGKISAPASLFILEKHYQECPGGIQISYLCKYFTINGYVTSLFNEIELIEHPTIKD